MVLLIFLSATRNHFFEQIYSREVLIWLLKYSLDLDKLCDLLLVGYQDEAQKPVLSFSVLPLSALPH